MRLEVWWQQVCSRRQPPLSTTRIFRQAIRRRRGSNPQLNPRAPRTPTALPLVIGSRRRQHLSLWRTKLCRRRRG